MKPIRDASGRVVALIGECVQIPAPTSLPLQRFEKLTHYIQLNYFRALLESQTLKFRRQDKQSDPLDGSHSKAKAEHSVDVALLKSLRQNPSEINRTIEGQKVAAEIQRRFTYLHCWTRREDESAALWNSKYGDFCRGVCIKTSAHALCSSLTKALTTTDGKRFELALEPVEYADMKLPTRAIPSNVIINFKSDEFHDEQEARLTALWINRDMSMEDLPEFLSVPVNLKSLLERVFIGTNVSNEDFSELRKLTDTLVGSNVTFRSAVPAS